MDGMLSQEEINALLNGMDTGAANDEPDASEDNQVSAEPTSDTDTNMEELLTPEEKDAIGEVANISMGTAATTLFSLVNNVVDITVPKVSYATWDNLVDSYDRPCVFVQLSYVEGIEGNNVLVLKEQDVKIITDLMMGGDGHNVADELNDLHLSAISEAMNQMMGSSATSLSQMLGRKIDISPPVASLIDLNDGIVTKDLASYLTTTFVIVKFRMVVGDLIDSEIMQLYPITLVKEILNAFKGSVDLGGNTEEPAPPVQEASVGQQTQPEMPMPDMANGAQPTQDQAMQGQPMQGQMPYGMPMQGQPMQGQMPYGMPMQGQPMQGQMPYGMPMMGQPYVSPDVNAQTVQFQPFTSMPNPITQQENIDLIMDVPLEVTVELGKTSKSIKEILEFAPGTIIELDKLAGEPVDVIVNGKYVAKGEVVVIEESFGVRVTEIVKQNN